MTNQKLRINNIAGIEEISDTDAANFNGGADFDIELFFDDGFPETNGADGIGFTNSFNALVNAGGDGVNINNQTSSIRINEGEWEIYNGRDFTGNSLVVGFAGGGNGNGNPIELNQAFLSANNLNDNISSIRRIA